MTVYAIPVGMDNETSCILAKVISTTSDPDELLGPEVVILSVPLCVLAFLLCVCALFGLVLREWSSNSSG